jgi:hypothetical protein
VQVTTSSTVSVVQTKTVTAFDFTTTVVIEDLTTTTVDETTYVTSTETDTSLSYTTTVVVTGTITADPAGQKRDVAATAATCPTTAAPLSTVPKWATACTNRAAFSSACSCVGAVHHTTTIAPCTTTKTLTHTVTAVSTQTVHPTVTVHDNVPITVTTTTTVRITKTGQRKTTTTSVTTATSDSTVVSSVVTVETTVDAATTSTSFTTITPSPTPTSFELTMTYTDGTVYPFQVADNGDDDIWDGVTGVPSAMTIDQNGNLVNILDGRLACISTYTFIHYGDEGVYFIDPPETSQYYVPITCQQPDWTATTFSIQCSFSYEGFYVDQFQWCENNPILELADGLTDGCIAVVPLVIPPS